MKKYNLSEIMKRAWKLVKKAGMTMSSALIQSWREAKSLKVQLVKRLEALVAEAGSHDNGYHYRIFVKDWENYGKSRTYFAVYETRDNSRHNKKISYGYFDNQTEKYVPEKYGDLTKDFTISGAAM